MKELKWAYFIQLSNHMHDDGNGKPRYWYYDGYDYQPENKIDFTLWDELIKMLHERHYNTLVIDVGDGVQYDSHPEISAVDAVSKEFLKQKLDEARALGITPIPKLNFSTEHHCWLKDYRRMVSSKIYRKVCVDLIDELCELFGHPELFHLGMDEETSYDSEQWREAVIMRGENLMFEDFGLMFDACRKNGARPWVWSDYFWINPEIFERRMPRDVVISNWFYGHFQDYPKTHFLYDAIRTFEELERMGFDQIPTCSTYSCSDNPKEIMIHCKKTVPENHLLGYLIAPWFDVNADNELLLKDGIIRFDKARKAVYPETL